ncbi:unnamed protein product [Schistocephalus solidus]|uniref:Uncharacterized protein n=1 Tax=Schistocephalus solidus TaxID=70667 RepID=A0A183SKC8_SCHSO|nr:unnamed protein product [Schistocephalus solidus]
MANRPKGGTLLVGRESARYKAGVAALCEIRYPQQSQLEEVGAGYTCLWIGCPRAVRREAEGALSIRNDVMSGMSYLSQGVNDRLITINLPRHATSPIAYELSITKSDDAKNKIHGDLYAILKTVSRADMLVFLDDLNVRTFLTIINLTHF